MYMVIHCGYCDQNYQVYQRDDLHGTHARQCPHCGSKIDRDTWISKVIPAFTLAAAANESMYQDHVDSHRPLYTVGFIPDHVFPDRSVADLIRELDIKPNLD